AVRPSSSTSTPPSRPPTAGRSPAREAPRRSAKRLPCRTNGPHSAGHPAAAKAAPPRPRWRCRPCAAAAPRQRGARHARSWSGWWTPMRVRRGLLFWGLFLIPIGAITLAVRAGLLDGDQLADAWRLWPLLFIGIGAAILLARSKAAIAGTVIIALLLGTLAGAALAAGPGWIVALSDCSVGERPTDAHLERSGTLAANATVRLEI